MTKGAPPKIPGLVFVQPLGSGGYADVFLYEQQSPRMPVAVKVLKSEGLTDALRQQFVEEADTMAALGDHPYIVQVFRSGTAEDGRPFLVMKYYLDVLYENIIVASIKGPIANGVYWVNQHVIDNVLNYAGRGARGLGRFTYEYVDQRGVDGLVNGLATVTGEAGGEVRRVQTGRLQFYALLLIIAVGLFALSLWIFT